MTELNIQQLEEQQDELRRCIARLSYVGMGVSQPLDNALKILRDKVKSNEDVSQVSESIEQISKLLIAIDEPDTSDSQPTLDSLSDFVQMLQNSRLPVQLREKLSILNSNNKHEKAVQISQSIVDVIINYVEAIENTHNDKRVITEESLQFVNGSADKLGFFQRLFGKKKNTQTLPLADNSGLAVLPIELKISLTHLTDQLYAIEHYRAMAKNLAKKVASLNTLEGLSEILELITGAFVNLASHEHEQLERFLKSLDTRIERVNGFIANTCAYSQAITDDSQSLDHDLKNKVSEIRESVDGSQSLEVIKRDLHVKMDGIVEKVSQFYIKQVNSHKKLNQDIDSLQEQLRATEDESARLREEFAEQRMRAQTDPLTRLPNRYSYNERLTQEYNRWRRYRSPLSLVICDIDYFKLVNDQYGHAAGDEVLKEVAQYLHAGLRESDFIARYGGEEFVILLPETSLVDATKAMNKLRLGVSELEIKFDQHIIQTAISIGISEFENTDTAKAVFARADRALYRAKEKGRNQVCCQRAKVISS